MSRTVGDRAMTTSRPFAAGAIAATLCLAPGFALGAPPPSSPQPTPAPGWDQGRSVYERRVHSAETPEKVDWDSRVRELLREEPGDLVVTAVGDMIFNERISHLKEPERRNLLRILQEADVAIGNLEFSLNDRPELQKPFYNFRAGRDFAWEVVATGINLVALANNHALDFGAEGLKECLHALDLAGIAHAGAGQDARGGAPSRERCGRRDRRSASPSSPTCATGPTATAARTRPGRAWRRSTRRPSSSPAKGGKVEAVEGPQERDVEGDGGRRPPREAALRAASSSRSTSTT